MPNLGEKIHLANLEVDSETLELILGYYSHYSFHPPTIITENSRDLNIAKILPMWDLQYTESIQDEVLIKLLHSCLKLEMSPLFELICLTIARRLNDISQVQKDHKLNLEEYEKPECQVYLKNKYSWANK